MENTGKSTRFVGRAWHHHLAWALTATSRLTTIHHRRCVTEPFPAHGRWFETAITGQIDRYFLSYLWESLAQRASNHQSIYPNCSCRRTDTEKELGDALTEKSNGTSWRRSACRDTPCIAAIVFPPDYMCAAHVDTQDIA